MNNFTQTPHLYHMRPKRSDLSHFNLLCGRGPPGAPYRTHIYSSHSYLLTSSWIPVQDMVLVEWTFIFVGTYAHYNWAYTVKSGGGATACSLYSQNQRVLIGL